MVQSDQSFSYELSRDVENMAYFLSTKINKQKTQLTNSTKIALSKKKTLKKIKQIVFDPIFYDVQDDSMFYKLCEKIKKRQQSL